ncbi:MAG: hypothetical protein KOO62_11465 [candidate division Zixibacteria bacterium]|nr:hypothetical protein [candidate division Zixibacteria bacterium]
MKLIAAVIILILVWLSPKTATGQPADLPPEQFGLEHLCEYLNLNPNDISFRSDFTEPDSFRLKIVADLMARPLDMIDYSSGLRSAWVSGQPEIVAGILYSDLTGEHQTGRSGSYQPNLSEIQRQHNLHFANLALNQLLTRVALYLDVIIPKSTEKSLARLSKEQRAFLTKEFPELLRIGEEEEFFSVEETDSLENLEEAYTEQFVEFGTMIDKDPVITAGIECLRQVVLDVGVIRTALRRNEITRSKLIKSTGYLPDQSTARKFLGMQKGWAVGGPGNDYYEGDYSFILDVGGNDVYDLSYDPAKPHGVIIIDLSGDDYYRAQSDFVLGSGCQSVGLLLDFEGNDRYDARSFGLGSGLFGFGLLYDAEGDDRYDGDTHVQGAGTFGMGLLIDEAGRDIYNGALHCQGFGFVQGLGAIYEIDGSDSYYAGGKYKDIIRYEDHYLSLSQGFGYGLRPFASGGIGMIIDKRGNDSYYSDIFAQGTSYWWSLGMIYDSSGNDNYQSFQYAQGTATHMSLGVLIDDSGNDVYFGKGLMQGCGHDYSCGLLLDRGGDDTYTAYDLSQAAGSANGAGVLIDTDGDDRYSVHNPDNTHGYGNPRRSFGSIGLFIDLSGSDQYNGYGQDNYYWKTPSKWGGGMDIELNPPDTTSEEVAP